MLGMTKGEVVKYEVFVTRFFSVEPVKKINSAQVDYGLGNEGNDLFFLH